MAMTPRERVEAAMKLESLDRPPAAIFTQSATVGQMDALNAPWPAAHSDANLMATLATGTVELFGFEAARTTFCLTAETERLGAEVQLDKKDAAPMIRTHPAHFDAMMGEYDDLSEKIMPIEEYLKGGRVAEVIKSVELLKNNKVQGVKKWNSEEYAICAGNTGVFTICGNLCDTENIIFGMMMDTDAVDKWTSFMAPYVKAYTQALIDAGADVVQCSEPSGSTDMLSPDMFEEAAGKPCRESLGATTGGFGNILHICGDTLPILNEMATVAAGCSIEEKVEAQAAVDAVGGKTVLVGNVGSVRPLYQGSLDDVKAGVSKSVEAGFTIISSGCGIAPSTSNENMQCFVDTVKSYGQ
ncbi:MAG: methylcobamide--CoM methyltransferase [archaeon]|nr:methylcobamide--CoM methyltransferase [archaeon]